MTTRFSSVETSELPEAAISWMRVGCPTAPRLSLRECRQRFGSGITAEGALAGDHLVEHGHRKQRCRCANRQPIRGLVPAPYSRPCPSPYRLRLGSWSASGHWIPTLHPAHWRQLGQAEIENFDAAFAGKKNVFRIQVAMDDVLVVRRQDFVGTKFCACGEHLGCGQL